MNINIALFLKDILRKPSVLGFVILSILFIFYHTLAEFISSKFDSNFNFLDPILIFSVHFICSFFMFYYVFYFKENFKLNYVSFFRIILIVLFYFSALYLIYFRILIYIYTDGFYQNLLQNNIIEFYFMHTLSLFRYVIFSLFISFLLKSNKLSITIFEQNEVKLSQKIELLTLKSEKINDLNKIQTLKLENQKLRQQQLETEYNYLKAQINPHFLYNTLNHFYSKALFVDEKTAEGILLLSNIMRYSLSSGSTNGTMLLKDELENMETYIALQAMRFGNKANVKLVNNLNLPLEQCNYEILPHVIMTLLENGYKHGDITNANHPMILQIDEGANALIINCINKEFETKGLLLQSTKLGLKNTKERILLAYGAKASLTNESINGYYSATFKVDKDTLFNFKLLNADADYKKELGLIA